GQARECCRPTARASRRSRAYLPERGVRTLRLVEAQQFGRGPFAPREPQSKYVASPVETPHGHPPVGRILALMANRDCFDSMMRPGGASADCGCRAARHGDGVA